MTLFTPAFSVVSPFIIAVLWKQCISIVQEVRKTTLISDLVVMPFKALT